MNVTWDEKVCIHSGNCVKSLPQVFMIQDGKFVIKPEAASREQVEKTVKACPSGALKMVG